MRNFRFLKYVGFAILGIRFVILAVFLVMYLWNWLIPALFHGPVLTFWQTAGIFLLSKILLSGIAPRRPYYYKDRSGWKRRYHGRLECMPDKSEEEPAKT